MLKVNELLLKKADEMIRIEEVTKETLATYWADHWSYLNRDIFPCATLGEPMDVEDYDYFKSEAYRGVMEGYMTREPDRAHMVYFIQQGMRIGAAQYVTYKSEDGKCFLMEFWVFPEFRGNGMGHRCYEAFYQWIKKDEAQYIALNISNERNKKFWTSIGFVEAGEDEWGLPIMQLQL